MDGDANSPLAKFYFDMKNLESWILQIDHYYTIAQTHTKQ